MICVISKAIARKDKADAPSQRTQDVDDMRDQLGLIKNRVKSSSHIEEPVKEELIEAIDSAITEMRGSHKEASPAKKAIDDKYTKDSERQNAMRELLSAQDPDIAAENVGAIVSSFRHGYGADSRRNSNPEAFIQVISNLPLKDYNHDQAEDMADKLVAIQGILGQNEGFNAHQKDAVIAAIDTTLEDIHENVPGLKKARQQQYNDFIQQGLKAKRHNAREKLAEAKKAEGAPTTPEDAKTAIGRGDTQEEQRRAAMSVLLDDKRPESIDEIVGSFGPGIITDSRRKDNPEAFIKVVDGLLAEDFIGKDDEATVMVDKLKDIRKKAKASGRIAEPLLKRLLRSLDSAIKEVDSAISFERKESDAANAKRDLKAKRHNAREKLAEAKKAEGAPTTPEDAKTAIGRGDTQEEQRRAAMSVLLDDKRPESIDEIVGSFGPGIITDSRRKDNPEAFIKVVDGLLAEDFIGKDDEATVMVDKLKDIRKKAKASGRIAEPLLKRLLRSLDSAIKEVDSAISFERKESDAANAKRDLKAKRLANRGVLDGIRELHVSDSVEEAMQSIAKGKPGWFMGGTQDGPRKGAMEVILEQQGKDAKEIANDIVKSFEFGIITDDRRTANPNAFIEVMDAVISERYDAEGAAEMVDKLEAIYERISGSAVIKTGNPAIRNGLRKSIDAAIVELLESTDERFAQYQRAQEERN